MPIPTASYTLIRMARSKPLPEAKKREIMQEMGARGGAKSRAGMSQADASKLGSRAVRVRWARYRRDNGMPPKAGDAELLK
jgi:hypothetical protein